MGLELLRAAAAVASPANGASPTSLPVGTLRFSLLYRTAPNLAAERRALEKLLGAGGFDLFPLPSGDDPLVLILQFAGVPREQSTGYLFACADDLAEELGLAACTPDADPGWLAEGVMGATPPESAIGGIIWALCTTHGGAPADARWSVKAVRADAAWARFNTTGAGIRIGQPDTGVADHSEMAQGLDLAAGTDILAGGGPPVDPLSASMKSPGHGTATSSVAVSRKSGTIVGVAPGATLVPIRCVDHVLLSSGAALASAIDHARKSQCDIVTMSLGGPFEFQDLKRAIGRAVDAGMIVMAAAGNCVKIVVYPAWDENVIAVAATSSLDAAWKGTSIGSKIDVAAPGEDVYVARRKAADDAAHSWTEPGQGTSYAVATLAGCAALWLAHHTRKAVRAEAAARQTTVQALFRAAVRQTARVPADWPTHTMGAGIVDAEALLALPLGQIATGGVPVESAHPARAELGVGFDWTRHGTEAGFHAIDAAQRRNPDRAVALESTFAPRASAGLAAALDRQGALRPSRLAAPRQLTLRSADLTPGKALRVMAKIPGGGAEANGLITEASARSYLQGSGRQDLIAAFGAVDQALENEQAARAASGAPTDTDVTAQVLRARVRALVPQVIDRFASGAATTAGDFSGEMRFAAEALIKLTGRPALRLVNGAVQSTDPQLGDWRGNVRMNHTALKPLIDAVGRIDIEDNGHWVHVGTGTHVKAGIILTNRHVMEAFAEQFPAADGRRFEMTRTVSIIFDDDARKPSQRFRITGVIAAGPDRIGRYADPRKLDLAFLSVESENALGTALPAPAVCGDMPDPNSGVPQIAVVGYPAAPGDAAFIDPATDMPSDAIEAALWRIYGTQTGVKYLSPGEVMPTALPGDFRSWAFGHDATTLGGNSGSALLSLGAVHAVCGLHFGGSTLEKNMAHVLSTVRASAAADRHILAHDWPI